MIMNNGHETKRRRAYELLRQAIVLRQARSGERLREIAWCERLGVNRSALREACAQLCAEGLVCEGERGGFFVRAVDQGALSEVLEARAALECAAAERLCRSGLDRRHRQALAGNCEQFGWLVERAYWIQLDECDRRFHEALVAAAKSPILLHLYHCLPHIEGQLVGGGGDPAAAARRCLNDHQGILKALAGADEGQARSMLAGHLGGAQRISA